MRITNTFLLFIVFLIISCEKNGTESIKELTDGFCIMSNDKVVINHNDFEYYDYSTHLIYMKNHKSFANDIEEIGGFTVYADGAEIYSGQTLPWFSSLLPFGPVIRSQPSFYGDYIIPIGFIQIFDSLGNVTPDPREDVRIIEALQKYDQYHSGLSCEINSVQYSSPNNVVIELQLNNNDSFDYYYLDPDKMGVNLFHYFTNGLFLRDFANKKVFTHKIEIIHPETWDTWKTEWLSLIKSNESKIITITYDSFENVLSGQYKATFEFPGLSHQVGKDDIQQNNGKIWLGELNLTKDITIE